MERTTEERLAALGVRVPEILLPAADVAPEKFAVIACDQFSAQPEYWRRAQELVGETPSALHMILPEAYLAQQDAQTAARLNATMDTYLDGGALHSAGETFVFVERQTSGGLRRGLVAALDLERYDYSAGSRSLIRATEATVAERLPARIAIRRGAPLELPHIMVLVDDRDDLLMGGLAAQKKDMEVLYDFELMLGGGHIRGYRAADGAATEHIASALEKLAARGDGMLFAMGDGNHSFAAAKACWDEMKKTLSPEEREKHPARYALCELVNVYDPGLTFEPIHRLLYGVDPLQVQREVGFDAQDPPSLQELQPRLDVWLKAHPQAALEYIHGAGECRTLAAQAPDRLAVVFGAFDRDTLFDVVREKGAFVRKSFSMGCARDKRYYLEARRIR